MGKTKNTYVPYFRWGLPLRVGSVELHEIGYDTKTKEIVITLDGDGVFRISHVDRIDMVATDKEPK